MGILSEVLGPLGLMIRVLSNLQLDEPQLSRMKGRSVWFLRHGLVVRGCSKKCNRFLRRGEASKPQNFLKSLGMVYDFTLHWGWVWASGETICEGGETPQLSATCRYYWSAKTRIQGFWTLLTHTHISKKYRKSTHPQIFWISQRFIAAPVSRQANIWNLPMVIFSRKEEISHLWTKPWRFSSCK